MKHYSVGQVNVSLAGKVLGGGYDEGSFFVVRRKSPSFSSKVGADGEVTRSSMKDRRGEFEIRLMQTSADNDWLSALFLLDENSENGAGVGALSCEDMNGSSLHFAKNAWLTEWPEADFAAEAGPRIWKGECELLENFVGGT